MLLLLPKMYLHLGKEKEKKKEKPVLVFWHFLGGKTVRPQGLHMHGMCSFLEGVHCIIDTLPCIFVIVFN